MSFKIQAKEKMDVEFRMLVGLPGSGKSTYANEPLYKMVYNIYSSDNLREELFNNVNDQSNNEKVFNILFRRIKKDLENGQSVILDATNIRRKHRKHILRELGNIPCKKTCLIMCTPYEECLINNKHRDRQVPDEVIKNMYKNFNIPFYDEGWDEIDLIYINNEYKYYYGPYGDFIYKYMNTDQGNPHHSLTLGDHCYRCCDICSQLIEDSFVNNTIKKETLIACTLHDCGKPFTKFKDTEGIYHYYNHENVGSYNSLFFDMGQELQKSKLVISALIGFHMLPYKFKKMNEVKINNYKKELKYNIVLKDINFYEALMLVHVCDKLSH